MKNSKQMGIRLLGSTALLLGLSCDGMQSSGPSAADFSAERGAIKAAVAPTPSRVAAPARAGVEEAGGVLGAEAGSYRYDSTGKRDPFRSFLWDRSEIIAEAPMEGPLEKFDIGQLSLLAVIWKTGDARALVQDPSGGNYIVSEGARMGKNSGRVTRIEDGLVVVRETYVDYLGQETRKDIEMRMRRNEGG